MRETTGAEAGLARKTMRLLYWIGECPCSRLSGSMKSRGSPSSDPGEGLGEKPLDAVWKTL